MTMRLALSAFVALLATACSVPGAIAPSTKPMGAYRPGELMVLWKPDATADTQNAVLARYGVTRTDGEGSPRQLLSVPSGQELDLASKLRREASVAAAEPDYVKQTQEIKGSFRPLTRSLSMVTNDPFFVDPATGKATLSPMPSQPALWGLRIIKADSAWDTTAGSANVLVATIDTGADMRHPDLVANLDVKDSKNFVEPNSAVDDDFGHGTHVAGIIAAVGNNGVGVVGVAWKTRVMPIRVLGVDGTGSAYDTVAALEYAVSKGAKVVNLSLGSPDHSDIEDQAIQDAVNAGVTVVAASGNEAEDGNYIEYPSAYPNVISVGAIGPDLKRAAFSNFNSHVTVAAPGVDILSTIPTRFAGVAGSPIPYGYLSGTSMATPMVSGVAALILSRHPNYTPAQVAAVLQKTAAPQAGAPGDAAGYNVYFGSGIVDASQAVQ